MTKFFFKALMTILVVIASHHALAQTPTPTASATASDVAALRQQVEALTETVKALQQQVKDQQATLEKANITGNQLPQSEGTPSVASVPVPTPLPGATAQESFPTTDSSVVANAPTAPGAPAVNANGTATGQFPTTDESVVATPAGAISPTTGTPPTETSTGSSLTQPITIAGGGKNYMNISFDGLFALAYSSAPDLYNIEVGDHDPQQRGFNARNIELALDGAVDPYFEGFANIVFKLDNDNETEVEVEEAFMQTTSLPFNLQLKGGQFFAAFGRLNPVHPHAWDFADAPLVSGLFLGPDGLRGVGAQISWTLPLPWYSQLIFAGQNGRGGTGFSFRNPGDLSTLVQRRWCWLVFRAPSGRTRLAQIHGRRSTAPIFSINGKARTRRAAFRL